MVAEYFGQPIFWECFVFDAATMFFVVLEAVVPSEDCNKRYSKESRKAFVEYGPSRHNKKILTRNYTTA